MTKAAAGNEKVCLLAGSRTPIGKFGRSLKRISVDKLAQHVMINAIKRANIHPSQIDGIALGHGYQSAYTPNTARFSALNAGLPAQIPAMTVQRQCGSGMEAVNIGMREIAAGNADIYLAGGAESMSTVPYLTPGILRFSGPLSKYFRFGPRPFGGLLDDGLVPTCLYMDMKTTHMAGTAQRVADTYGISREEADQFALRSHKLAAVASDNGRFALEIDPISTGKGYLELDEHVRRDTTYEALAAMKPDPRLKTRSITAGNSSGINDGACALILSSMDKANELGEEPLAYLVDSCVVGVDPEQMGLGPVAAIETLLERNNLTLADIDLFEINEAFASQYLAVEKLLGLSQDKVNVNGGAIALGHPIGMSGARLILTLAHELRIRKLKRGIASLCIGGGMGIATLIEAV